MPASPSNLRRVLLVATMCNEGPFILEWVAYHLAIGFTEIVVCTNGCLDESPALLDRLGQLAPLTHLRTQISPGGKPQLEAYQQAEALPATARADWAMVLDADEFLNIHAGRGQVGDLIDAVPEATAILVNWRMFGNGGREIWQEGFVVEQFTRAAARDDAVNLSFKTLFRHIDAYACKLMPHQPRYPAPARLDELVYVDGAGERLPRYFVDESRDSFLQSESGSVRWTLAQVNHYNTRSREDYLLKHRRGGGLNIAWDRDDSWASFNKNDQIDVSLASKLGPTRALVERWLEDDELRRRHRRCCDLYAAHGADLRAALAAEPGSR